jgi:hypothetical protein
MVLKQFEKQPQMQWTVRQSKMIFRKTLKIFKGESVKYFGCGFNHFKKQPQVLWTLRLSKLTLSKAIEKREWELLWVALRQFEKQPQAQWTVRLSKTLLLKDIENV